MTSDELVKAVLTEENTELYDKVRIANLIKNISLGYGKIAFYDKYITISFPAGRSKRITYFIDKSLLTPEQLIVINTIPINVKSTNNKTSR